MQIGIDTTGMYTKTNKQLKGKPRCNHNNAPRDILERKAEVFFFYLEILSTRQYFRLEVKRQRSDSIKYKMKLTHHSWM